MMILRYQEFVVKFVNTVVSVYFIQLMILDIISVKRVCHSTSSVNVGLLVKLSAIITHNCLEAHSREHNWLIVD